MATPPISPPSFGERKLEEDSDIAFNKAPVENVIYSNDGKASIVLGGDRNKALDSGYSGKGFPDSSAIDIVCGRGKTLSKDDKAKAININPDFFSDAARIYISEKTDVDKNFALVKGGIGNSIGASAIALKADSIRVIGVEGVKIVTRANPTNSNGTESGVKGIELIAGNDDSFLQPMVLGDNLVSCLKDITQSISDVGTQVHSVMNFLEVFVNNYAEHIHPPPGTAPSITAALMKTVFPFENATHASEDNQNSDNLVSIKNNYMNLPKDFKSILSQYNKTN